MSARLADERGFTLVELLVTMVISLVILFALFGLVDKATRQQSIATDRIDSNDRGRTALDIITAQLRSRVCIDRAQGALVAASATTLEFYSSLGLTTGTTTTGPQLIVQRRQLEYRPASSDVVEKMWTSNTTSLPAAATTTPNRTRTLLTGVSLVPDSTPPLGDPPTPFFSYSAVGDEVSGATLATPLSLGTALTAAQLAKQKLLQVRVNVSFAAGGRIKGINTPFQTQIIDRSAGCFFGS
jgi:prepilin-type N-terminal cleavage/methylation domain-containing protein